MATPQNKKVIKKRKGETRKTRVPRLFQTKKGKYYIVKNGNIHYIKLPTNIKNSNDQKQVQKQIINIINQHPSYKVKSKPKKKPSSKQKVFFQKGLHFDSVGSEFGYLNKSKIHNPVASAESNTPVPAQPLIFTPVEQVKVKPEPTTIEPVKDRHERDLIIKDLLSRIGPPPPVPKKKKTSEVQTEPILTKPLALDSNLRMAEQNARYQFEDERRWIIQEAREAMKREIRDQKKADYERRKSGIYLQRGRPPKRMIDTGNTGVIITPTKPPKTSRVIDSGSSTEPEEPREDVILEERRRLSEINHPYNDEGFEYIPESDEHEGSGKFSNWRKGLYDNQIEKIINKECKKFVPVIMSDEIPTLLPYVNENTEEFAFVINSTSSKTRGEHWRACFIDIPRFEIDYYDPLVSQPSKEFLEDIKLLIDKIAPVCYLKLKINMIKDQSDSSNNCGFLSSKFIIDRFKGKKFKEATKVDKSDIGERTIEKWKNQI